ncbi:ROK family protein [Salirhabdus salicampi]|uniref:ROK family protein n=1 Tax=Salirhabdus salicampi TaxID=476102 RepID=UPI0020C3C8E6|nr:ROK family protein [Salirhabdus salicampi]MCP8617566.1 ROK family protein [Salirhabdus salicampi]
MLFGAIEAGGTKFVVAVGKENGEVVEKKTIPTTTPDETIREVEKFFANKQLTSVGVGTFGPVDLNSNRETYGFITTTPKVKWQNYNLLGELKEILHVPVAIDTDVNVAALGEKTLGAAKDVDSCLYLTVGTGIGGGAVMNGQTVKGLSHPEMGHVRVVKHPNDSFSGTCPFHGSCLEGMASGPAIKERWGESAEQLQDRNEVWEMEAYYIAQGLVSFMYTLSPEKMILGGGVMQQKQLFSLIHEEVYKLNANYYDLPILQKENIHSYIVPPELGSNAGIVGALLLAEQNV